LAEEVWINHRLLATESEFYFSLEQSEHFLEVVPMRAWTSTVGQVHFDQAVTPVGLGT
jgi:hypothetical protein